MKKNSMNDQIDHRLPLLPSNFVQTILTCVILYTCIMATVEFLIKVWRRMRFNQSKTSCFKYGYSNTKKNGPKYWRELFACCDGANQSPINIDTCAATCVYACNPLTWSNFDNKPQNMIMLNTGSTVMLAGCWYWDKPLSISGGPLEQRSYSLKEVYFRWGRGEGSEHTIDSVRFPMEIQLRFINQTNGDNVFIALFCEISHQDNPNLVCLVNSLNEIILPGTSTEIPFSFDWLQLPFCHGYYTYPGSFTFPPCCENVTWIVKPQPIKISHAQIYIIIITVQNNRPLKLTLCHTAFLDEHHKKR
ncbi:carbonic anhydrase 2 isoform X1 [Nilaparvata lugens]|uniref:carbonic anhydrase 2 isoform X1 n=1 Tax=Nilaparvata lugens TaxID=108931 RepID=UPI00193E1892|nr:carbonic anhydrase 2 isoform X1 [Nilaparvata lugens]